MARFCAVFGVLFALVAVNGNQNLHPLSDEFIDLINSKQNFWSAGRNFPKNTPISYLKNLLGALEDKNFHNLRKVDHLDDIETRSNLPESFDSREKWPNCPSLNEVRDQGSCGSCWAFGAVEAMTDRYCIYSDGKQHFHFSAQDLLTCCDICGSGCNGGYPSAAWYYWESNGIVSGGNYNSSEGCKPYEIPACEHHAVGPLPPCGNILPTPSCNKTCNTGYNTDYEKDKRRGKTVYSVDSNEESIKTELLKNGPLEVSFVVYTDFFNYKEGVYVHTDAPFAGRHAVKMLGWGVENGVKYWLVANSWNPNWGTRDSLKYCVEKITAK
ncbi:unnamed protein product [Spodoptera littoralis]|uniref:Peptidase C1A papain C-terminal domain-containing protein n=1 Tax=Spodoptera littoralis TaxID=7109 RepID=A0A9P0ICM2_SPOLI|nr:unnamed protein product [Spodoptera littoralis]CAH1645473.1 unnamed protein product [Spodoptera littoralis]